MSRTALTVQVPAGPYPSGGTVSPGGLDLSWTAADVANGNLFPFSGKEVLLIQNTDTGSHHLTLTSAPDSQGRSDDITTYSLAAGDVACFNYRGGSNGWRQSDGNIYLTSDSALVKFAVLSLPS